MWLSVLSPPFFVLSAIWDFAFAEGERGLKNRDLWEHPQSPPKEAITESASRNRPRAQHPQTP
jgi:hypothetical protein